MMHRKGTHLADSNRALQKLRQNVPLCQGVDTIVKKQAEI
jgi:hypothetical protein